MNNTFEHAKHVLAAGVRDGSHEDIIIHDRRLYRITVEKLDDPEEIDAAIRKMTDEATK